MLDIVAYEAFPAALLGRLAVDRRYRGRGFGELLLVDALRRVLVTSRAVAALAVVVDAQDDSARAFYARYGLLRVVDDEYRLYLPMRTITQLQLGTARAIDSPRKASDPRQEL